MTIYMLSGMNEKNDYYFYEDIVNIFKKDFNANDSITYITGHPKKSGNAKKQIESDRFTKEGIKFKKVYAIDDMTSEDDANSFLNDSNIVFLFGGNPVEQIELINKLKIKECILCNKKAIISLSAGSINLSNKAICSKDEEFESTICYDGLGICNFSFEPHFDINNKEVLADLIKLSKDNKILAFENSAFCILRDNEYNYYGNVYEINNEKVDKIKDA